MNTKHFFLILSMLFLRIAGNTQTAIPNGDFELWKAPNGNYQDPLYWDTPNPEVANIPFIGVVVVSRSTDHESGSYSVKLETKHLTVPPLDIPGFITLGNLTLNLSQGTYVVTGGAPITDNPTHLMGYYKYSPVGGDSCVIAIGLLRTDNTVRDTVGSGYFSTKATVTDWTPFSAYITYTLTGPPDSMNVFALSTAQETNMHVGTILYVDNLTLDYSVGMGNHGFPKEIDTYLDRETRRLLVFFHFDQMQQTSLALFSMTGMKVAESSAIMASEDRMVIDLCTLPKGVYLLEVLHDGNKFCKKFFINF